MTRNPVKIIRGKHVGQVGLIAGNLSLRTLGATRCIVQIGGQMALLQMSQLREISIAEYVLLTKDYSILESIKS